MIEKESVVVPDHSLDFDGICGWRWLSSLGSTPFFGTGLQGKKYGGQKKSKISIINFLFIIFMNVDTLIKCL